MDSYVIRIYSRGDKKSRILIGTVEVAGAEKKMAFSNIEELWDVLGRRKGQDLFTPPSPRRRSRKEVMSATATSDTEDSAEGVRQNKPTLGPRKEDSR